MSWKFTYGLCNNLEVYTVIPYIHNWAGNVNEAGPNGERAADFGGLGDISLTFKYRLVEEGPVAPTVSALFTPTFPSGHFQHLNPGRLDTDQLGSGSYNFTTGLNLSKYVRPFIFYANFWYTMGTAYNTREDRSPLLRDENSEIVEGDPVSTRLRLYPRDFADGESGRGVPRSRNSGQPWWSLPAPGMAAGYSAIRPTYRQARWSRCCRGLNIWPQTKFPGPGGEYRLGGARTPMPISPQYCPWFTLFEPANGGTTMKIRPLLSLGLASLLSAYLGSYYFSRGSGPRPGLSRPAPITLYHCPVSKVCKPKMANFSGKVVRLLTETLDEGMYPGMAIILDTKNEGQVHVHLGPVWYLERQDFVLQPGDEVSVKRDSVKNRTAKCR